MDNIEKFYIYNETRKNIKINDKNRVKPNATFDTIISQDPHRVPTVICP